MTEITPEAVAVTRWSCPVCRDIFDTTAECAGHIRREHSPPSPEALALVGRYVQGESYRGGHSITLVDRAVGTRAYGRTVFMARDGRDADRTWFEVGATDYVVLSGEEEARALWSQWCREHAKAVQDEDLAAFAYLSGGCVNE